jgi:molybdopterin-biosynthesis enzyme MoeA-like protein
MIGVLIIGDEILSGRHSDKHLAKSIELLNARGLPLAWARYCGDDRPRLIETLQQTFATGEIVFSFGGIGATPDDHTRQCAAAARGVPLQLHPEAAQLIHEASLSKFGVPATPERLMMGEFPEGAQIIPNPFNRIPGFSLGTHHFLPGFPQMSWPMMEWVLDTHYAHLQHQRDWAEDAIAVGTVQESQLIGLMSELQTRFGVTLFLAATPW